MCQLPFVFSNTVHMSGFPYNSNAVNLFQATVKVIFVTIHSLHSVILISPINNQGTFVLEKPIFLLCRKKTRFIE